MPQKTLFGFLEKREKEEMKETVGEGEVLKNDVEKIAVRKSGQIETDYYEKSRIDSCTQRLREKFNVNIEILPVRYGISTKSPLKDKIYGYYMLITIKTGDRERIVEFIREECGLKVY